MLPQSTALFRAILFHAASMATSLLIVLENLMLALLQTVDLALGIYTWILIGSAVFSWLYAFNIVNSRNAFVASLGDFLYRATEPALRPLRRIIPNLGGIDVSPIVLLLIIFFLRRLIWTSIAPALLG
jgi:YggT family protein